LIRYDESHILKDDQAGCRPWCPDVLPTAVIAAEAMAIPAVMMQHFPEYLPGPNRPPGVMGILPGKGIPGRFRDRLLTKLFNGFINKYSKLINKVRTSYELPPIDNTTDIFFNSDLRLLTTLKSFNFPIEPLPENFYYTGPILGDPDWVEPWSNPWNDDDELPLVVISLFTTYQNQAPTIQSTLDALKDMDVRGLVTPGPAIEEEKFNVPDNVVVVKSAPHSQIFPMADLVITHAGHGTIMRSLQHGVPLICLPMGRDQDDNAVKINYHGCGLKLKPGSSSVKIKKAMEKILKDSRFKRNAQKFQKELNDNPSHQKMIEKIENLNKPHYNKKVQMANMESNHLLQAFIG
jgi:MGT family glycosyltransferase